MNEFNFFAWLNTSLWSIWQEGIANIYFSRIINNYSPKTKCTFADIYRDGREVNTLHLSKYSPMFTEPEVNNCFSIIFRGDYLELQNDGLKKNGITDAIVRLHTRVQQPCAVVVLLNK